MTARTSELVFYEKREKVHYFVNATRPPTHISRNKTATVTKLLGEKNTLLREKRPVIMKEQDLLYDKKTLRWLAAKYKT